MMVNRCPNCGGLVNYDISAGQLKCESCDSMFSPENFHSETGAKENAENAAYKMSIFTCPNCGGSIASNEMEAVEYCLYCGSFVTLESQVKKIRKPDFILPFTKTKEDCKKYYARMASRKLYAPKEFRNADFLDNFKGIYIPYWTYNFQVGPDAKLEGMKETRHGDYIHKQKYTIDCKLEGQLDGISFDASSSFDDDISNRIIPFEASRLVPFKPSYMFGFFADTADIPESVYEEEASAIARNEIWDSVSSDSKVMDGYPERPYAKDFDSVFNVKKSAKLSLLPVWFLTWRKKDRVAYSVLNGDNGEIYSEIPVDIKRYLLFSLLLAIPIFAVLSLFTFNAAQMLKLSLVLSFLMVMLYTFQLDKIVRKVLHADDLGYTSVHKEEARKAAKVTDNFLTSFVGGVVSIAKSLGFIGIVIALALLFAGLEFIPLILAAAILGTTVYIFFRLGKNCKLLGDVTVWLDILGSLVSLFLSIVMLIADPAGDEFYYLASVICIVGVGLTATFTVRRYNELATRPLPHFFNRKAGGKH